MKKFLKISAICFSTLIVIYVVLCCFGESHFFIKKEIDIKASADSVFMKVGDYKQWNKWSPWTESDPGMKNEFIGSPQAIGHKWKWESESQGNGSQTILAMDYPNKIRMELNFEGMDASYTHWNFVSLGETTRVSWDMDGGEVAFIQRGIFMLFKGMIESDYEKGLQNLKKVCEK
ncbi:MAG: SRPBCC family protein [Bacteroidota bacterium]